MTKSGKKKMAGEKRVPKLVEQKKREKRSRRNSWISSLTVILILVALSLFWYFSNKPVDDTFVSRFDAFSCELPENWVSHDLDETLTFDSSLGESSHPHLFAPKSFEIKSEEFSETTLEISPEILEALEKNRGNKATPIDDKLKEDIAKKMNITNDPSNIDEAYTVITACIFTKEKTDQDIKRYIGGVGGINDPEEFFLEELEKIGTKIPGVEYGYYLLQTNGHPVGIIKNSDITIIFNGIFDETSKEDVESLFLSIKIP
jgi:hypothetical protein